MEQDGEEGEELDHDPGALASMPFEMLQEECFDIDPRKRPSTSRDPSQSLAQHLTDLLTVEESQQTQALEDMDLKDWTATGEWIAARDSSLRQALVQNRESRRGLATRFEAEIQSRHESVCKMQTMINDMLTQMKRSGGMVLGKGASVYN